MIREWRDFRELTQEQLAEKVGLSNVSLSRIERGVQPYTKSTLEAIARALHCAPADLINGIQPDSPKHRIAVLVRKMSEDQADQALRVLSAVDNLMHRKTAVS